MKEKIKDIVKNKYFKIIVFILLWLFILRESYWIYIDRYNFEQLEKVKYLLENTIDKKLWYYHIKDFNKKYGISIEPIKNCYYISNNNWKYPYIFWFKLESQIYKIIYWDKYFSYPGYDMPVRLSWPLFTTKPLPKDHNPDSTRSDFEFIISNPCKE